MDRERQTQRARVERERFERGVFAYVSRRLTEELDAKTIQAADLAAMLGVERASITEWKNSVKGLSVGALFALMRHWGITSVDLEREVEQLEATRDAMPENKAIVLRDKLFKSASRDVQEAMDRKWPVLGRMLAAALDLVLAMATLSAWTAT